MGTPTPPPPVKLIIGLLSADPALFTQSTVTLQESYGPIDVESAVFPWNTTNYYREEMGENLLRKFVAFEPLFSPETLVRIKLETNALESALSAGILNKSVHASTPPYGRRSARTVAQQNQRGLFTLSVAKRSRRVSKPLSLHPAGTSSPPIPRRVNLDPGYLDTTKLVLVSTKNQAHRIYLAQGIYAEVTLLYHHGEFHPFLYTYSDYRWPETHEFLRRVRSRYLEQLRTRR